MAIAEDAPSILPRPGGFINKMRQFLMRDTEPPTGRPVEVSIDAMQHKDEEAETIDRKTRVEPLEDGLSALDTVYKPDAALAKPPKTRMEKAAKPVSRRAGQPRPRLGV